MITTLDQLTPATRAVADAWLESSVAIVTQGERDGIRQELAAALCMVLGADATPDDVADAVVRIGALDGETTTGDAYDAGGGEAFVLAAAYLVLVLAAVVAHYAVRGPSLPDELTANWDWCGRPAGRMTKRKAAATDVGLAVGGVALGVVSALQRGRGAGRMATLVAASALATVAGAVTVLRPLHRTS